MPSTGACREEEIDAVDEPVWEQAEWQGEDGGLEEGPMIDEVEANEELLPSDDGGFEEGPPIEEFEKVEEESSDCGPNCQTESWLTFFGSKSGDEGRALAVGDDCAVAVGYSEATWDGPSGQKPLHAHSNDSNYPDLVVLKLNSRGDYLWHTFYGVKAFYQKLSVEVDVSGNVFVAGSSYGSWYGPNDHVPLQAHNGAYDIFVLKLGAGGEYQWHTFFGLTNSDYGYVIKLTSKGEIFVFGQSFGRKSDLLLVKLGLSGEYLWHKLFGSIDQDDSGNALTLDDEDNIYCAGASGASWDGPSGQPPLNPHQGGTDVVVLKLNSMGSYLWHSFFGNNQEDIADSISFDKNGSVALTGYSTSPWLGPAGQPAIHPLGNRFILKLSSEGKYIWHTFHGPSDTLWNPSTLATFADNSLMVTGRSGTWVGPNDQAPLHACSGGTDVFLLRLDSGGHYLWHTFYGSPWDDHGGLSALAKSGDLFVTGTSIWTWLDPNGRPPIHKFNGSNYGDLFVLKLRP